MFYQTLSVMPLLIISMLAVLHSKYCDCGNECLETVALLSANLSAILPGPFASQFFFSFSWCLLPNILNGDDQVDKHSHRLSIKIMWLYLAASVTLRQLN